MERSLGFKSRTLFLVLSLALLSLFCLVNFNLHSHQHISQGGCIEQSYSSDICSTLHLGFISQLTNTVASVGFILLFLVIVFRGATQFFYKDFSLALSENNREVFSIQKIAFLRWLTYRQRKKYDSLMLQICFI